MQPFTITSLTLAAAFLLTASPSDAQETAKKTGPEKWEKDIAAFEARDKETPPPTNPVLFVGSSSIRLWDLEESWPDIPTVNNGFGGSTIADSLHYYDRAIAPYHAKAIVIYAGDNDINKKLTPEQVFEDFAQLAGKIRAGSSDVQVIYIAIKPSISRWELWPLMKQANDLIADFCAGHRGFHFADIAEPMLDNPEKKPDPALFENDGLHLNEKGYEAWRKVITPLLSEAIAD